MTSIDVLYAVVAGLLVIGVAIPAWRARRRWRHLRRPPVQSVVRVTGRRPLATVWTARRGWPLIAAAAGAGMVGFAFGGPVGGGVLACYGAAGMVMVRRRSRGRAESAARVAAVDAVSALAAELRAGLAVGPALASVRSSVEGPTVVGAGALAVKGRLAAAVELAETSGAPLADVLDRLDTHLRATERARASAEAQAAGALASAGLLAVMPIAGAGLGVLVGLDPAHVLLHTPIGAACLCAAVVLQLAGVAWSARLSRVEVTA